MKTTEAHPQAQVAAALLDRLVDGELDEAARAALLRQLDGEPGGWKRCALAFLEAQAWRQAISADAETSPAPRIIQPAPARFPVSRQLMALAAAVVVAFGVGFVSRDPAPVERHHPLAGGALTQALAVEGASQSPGVSPAVPESLRRQMERQGYRVDGDRKLVPVALEDGRKVTVPVDTVSLRYVGQRIH
jgi:hypothetical protein